MNGCAPFQSDSSNPRIVFKLMHVFGCKNRLSSYQDIPLLMWEMALMPKHAINACGLELNNV